MEASINHLCQIMVKAIPNNSKLKNLRLAGKEYYKIKTPVIQRYKKSVGLVFLGKISAELSRRNRLNGSFYWETPEGFECFEDMFLKTQKSHYKEWLKVFFSKVEEIHNKILILKNIQFEGKRDYYFYYNAVWFAVGLYFDIPWDFRKLFYDVGSSLFCYLVDIPLDLFDVLKKLYSEEKGRYEFEHYLPLALDSWSTTFNDARINTIFKEFFNSACIHLFDIMVDMVLLVNDTYKEPQHRSILRAQILSYYKFLKSNKIYLPEPLQHKIALYV